MREWFKRRGRQTGARRGRIRLEVEALEPRVLLSGFTTNPLRASVSAAGVEGDAASYQPALSADGQYLAFASEADNLVAGDVNGVADIFVRDLTTGAVELVSPAPAGAISLGSSRPSLSADGRYVAFTMDYNAGAGPQQDVFVYDRTTGALELISVATDGLPGDADSDRAAISADGRYVAFTSLADDLVKDDTNGFWDVFVRDRTLETTTRVSEVATGDGWGEGDVGVTEGDGDSGPGGVAISGDGSVVAFASEAANLDDGDTNGVQDIFYSNWQGGFLWRASVNMETGTQANGESQEPSLSYDGMVLAFASEATNLLSGSDINNAWDVFVLDLNSERITLGSLANDSHQANADSPYGVISSDGKVVAFTSYATNLTDDPDTNGQPDVFVHFLWRTMVKRVSMTTTGGEADSWSGGPTISSDGRYVGFHSNASNLVPNDNNGVEDVFVLDTAAMPDDTTGPRVVNMTPSPGSTVNELNDVSVVFNESLDPASVDETTFKVADDPGADGLWGTPDDAYVPGVVTYDDTTYTATFTPASPFSSSGDYGVWLDGTSSVTDAVGNRLDGEFNGAFPSGDGAVGGDFVAVFTYEIISPPPTGVDLVAGSDTGASDHDDLTRLDNSSPANALQFDVSGTVAGATVTLYYNNQAIGSAVATGTTTTITTNGSVDLPDGVRAITARQQNPGETESPDSPALNITVDTSAPRVTQTTPAPGAVVTAQVNQVDVVFDQDIDAASATTATFKVSSDAGADGQWGTADDTYVAGAVAYDPATRTATFTPTNPLDTSGGYAIWLDGTASIADEAGNKLDGEYSGALPSGDGAAGGDYVATFTIRLTSPAPTGVDLVAGSDTGASDHDDLTRLDNSAQDSVLQFDVSGTVAGATVTLYANGQAIGSAVATGTTTTVTTDGAHALPEGENTITARQQRPNDAESPDSPALQVGVDATAPRVTQVRPAPGITAIHVRKVVAHFDEALDPASVSASTMKVSSEAGADGRWGTADDDYVSGTVSYDAASRTAVFTPWRPLMAEGDYALWLDGTASIADLAGNKLDGEYASAFPSGNAAAGGDFVAEFHVTPPTTWDDPTFAGPQFSTGAWPVSLAAGDFDDDGLDDAAAALNEANQVAVLFGQDDDRGLGDKQLYAAGDKAVYVATADMDGDGALDLLVANRDADTVSVLYGNGDGTFQAKQDYASGGTSPVAIVAQDFNEDGLMDLAVANRGSTDIGILLASPAGGFAPAVLYAPGGVVNELAAVDFDGDGHIDLAAALDDAGGGFSVLLGDGLGVFALGAHIAGPRAAHLAVADWNQDGLLDVATVQTASGDSNVSVYWGAVGGGFSASETFAAGADRLTRVQAEDVDGNGAPDLLALGQNGVVTVWLNNGSGDLLDKASYAGESEDSYGMAFGDFDGDGVDDLLLSNSADNRVTVLWGLGDGTFLAREDYDAPKREILTTGDFNGDGHVDVALGYSLYYGTPIGAVRLGNGDGTFQPEITFDSVYSVIQIGAADFDSDGFDDLAMVHDEAWTHPGQNVHILLSNGDGTLQPMQDYAWGVNDVRALAIADFNEDGVPDLAGGGSGWASVLLGNGDGAFQTPVKMALTPWGADHYATGIDAQDFNGDGHTDLVVLTDGSPTGSNLAVFLGNGDGTFQSIKEIDTRTDLASINSGDFNGDGLLDLAAKNKYQSEMVVFFGDGQGGFAAGARIPGGGKVGAVSDLNGDGALDLVVLGSAGVLLGDGRGGFEAAGFYTGVGQSKSLDVADVNEDGLPDILLAGGDKLSVFVDAGYTRSLIDAPARGGVVMAGDTLRFAGTVNMTSAQRPASMEWNFGDGRISLAEDPGFMTFRTPGTYHVSFAATDRWGWTDPMGESRDIIVLPAPAAAPDLNVTALSLPAAWNVGQVGTVHYTVRNDGDAATGAAAWVDAAYLSADDQLDSEDVLLGSVPVAHNLLPGETYDGQMDLTMPGDASEWARYLILSVDDQWEVPEWRQLNNESAALVQATIPLLTPGVPVSAAFQADGAAHYYRIESPAPRTLKVTLDDADNLGGNELYVRYGALPTQKDYDWSATYWNYTRQPNGRWRGHLAADQSTSFTAAPGTWYVMVVGADAPPLGGYTLTAQFFSDLTVHRITPDTCTNDSNVILTVEGNGFDKYTQIDLVALDNTVYHSVVQNVSQRKITVAFDLSAASTGRYALRAIDPGVKTVEMPDALWVSGPQQPSIEAHLVTPPYLGFHAPTAFSVEYANTSGAQTPAPLLFIKVREDRTNTDYARLATDPHDMAEWGYISRRAGVAPAGAKNALQILASGETPGLLQPNESYEVPLYWGGWNGGVLGDYVFTLDILMPDDPTPVDWSQFKDQMRPMGVSEEGWDALWRNFVTQAGSTWGEYVQMLDRNAQYLAGLGEREIDVDELLWFEIQQADGLSPHPRTEPVVDAAAVGPGFDVELERVYPNSILGRYRMGPFGRGWRHSWELSLEERVADNLYIMHRAGAADRAFQYNERYNYYQGFGGDTGRLYKEGDGSFRLEEATGYVTHFDADGRFDYQEDANGNRVTAAYDAQGRLVSLTHSSGQSLQFEYNAAGLVSAVIDGYGRRVEYAYDAAAEHLTDVTYQDGSVIHYTYTDGVGAPAMHALTSIQRPGGFERHYEYDANGRLVNMFFGDPSDPQQPAHFAYGSAGEVYFSDDLGNTTTFYFDHRGLLTRIDKPVGEPMTVEYDWALAPSKATEGLGLSTSFQYRKGRLTGVTDALGQSTSFEYGDSDLPNNITGVSDPRRVRQTYTYDDRGNITEIRYNDGTTESFTYDAHGQMLSWTNRRGQTITFAYDAIGRLTSKTAPDGSVVSYTYDALGNLASMTDASGVTRYAYDAAGRMTRVDYADGRFLEYTYSPQGFLASMTDDQGYREEYAYDAAGRLTDVAGPGGQPIVHYDYDHRGRVARSELGNGAYSTYAYDAAGRIQQLVNYDPAGGEISRYDYDYDLDNQQVTADTTDGQWTYQFDAVGRLVRAQFASANPAVPDQDIVYEYDAAGNRTRVVRNGVETPYGVNNLNEYTHAGALTYAYDADGNLIRTDDGAGHVTTYTYDAESRLVAVDDGTHVYTNEYDGLGHLIATTVDGQATRFLFNPAGLGDWARADDATGAPTARYAYGLGLVAQTDAAGAEAFFTFTPRGDTSEVLDAAGAVLNDYVYSPFGEKLLANEAVPTPFRFAGQFGVADFGSGAIYMRARHYDPAAGRFLSGDPQLLAPNEEYTYVHNNPVSNADPSGLIYFACQGSMTLGRLQQYRRFLMKPGKLEELHRAMNELVQGVSLVSDVESLGSLGSGAASEVATGGHVINSIGGALADMAYGHFQGAAFNAIANRINKLFMDWYGGPVDRCVLNLMPDEVVQSVLRQLRQSTRAARSGGGKGGPDQHRPTVAGQALDQTRPQAVGAYDPNQKIGPAGYGAANYVAEDALLPYRIDFENDAAATAPAQSVFITDPLSADLDLSTFEFSAVGFGSHFIAAPAGLQHYETVERINSNGQDIDVYITLHLDVANRRMTARFESIDPNTGLPPANVMTGFLPPEDGTGSGQGFVSYTVRPTLGLSSGEEIRNVADIVFDANPPIATNQVDPHDPSQGTDPTKEALATIDAGTPTSQVAALPAQTTTPDFLVQWAGADEAGGSGVASYDIYVSVDGGAYSLWLDDTTATQGTYHGTPLHTYSFYSRATDHVGHEEAAPAHADATTRVTGTITTLDATQPVWSFLDADGDLVTFVFNGPGSADVLRAPTGDALTVTLANTTAATSLQVVVDERPGTTAGDGTTLQSITGSGLGALVMPQVDVVGNTIRLDGPAQHIHVRDLANGSDVTLNNAAAADSLVFLARTVGDVDLTFAGTLAYAEAASWSAGAITVNSVGTARAYAGDLGADITAAETIGGVYVQGGDLGGDITAQNTSGAAGPALNEVVVSGGDILGSIRVQNNGNAGRIAAFSQAGAGGRVGDAAADVIEIGGRVEQILSQGEAAHQAGVNATVTADQIGALMSIWGDVNGDVTVRNAAGAAGNVLGRLEAIGGSILGGVNVQNGDAGLIQARSLRNAAGAAVGGCIGTGNALIRVQVAGHLAAAVAIGDPTARGGKILSPVDVGSAGLIQSVYGNVSGGVTADHVDRIVSVEGDVTGLVRVTNASGVAGYALGELSAIAGGLLCEVRVENGGNVGLIRAQAGPWSTGAGVFGGQIAGPVTVGGRVNALLALGEPAGRTGRIMRDVTVGRVREIRTQYGDVEGNVTVTNAGGGAGYALGQIVTQGGDIQGSVTVNNQGAVGLILAQSISGSGGRIGDNAADQVMIGGRVDQIVSLGEAAHRAGVPAGVQADQIGLLQTVWGDVNGAVTATNALGLGGYALGQLVAQGGSILKSVQVQNGGHAGRIQATVARDAAGALVGGAIGQAGETVTVAGRLETLAAFGDSANRGGNIAAAVTAGQANAIYAQYGDITGDVTADWIGSITAAEGDVTGDVTVTNAAGAAGNALGELRALAGSVLGGVEVKNGGNAGLIQAVRGPRAAGGLAGGQIGAAGKLVKIGGHLGALLAIGEAASRGGDIVSNVTVGRADLIQSQYGDIQGSVTVNNNLAGIPAAAGYALGRLLAIGGDIQGDVTVNNQGAVGLILAQSIAGVGGRVGAAAGSFITIAGRVDQIVAQGEAGHRTGVTAAVTADQIGVMHVVWGDVANDVMVLNALAGPGLALGQLVVQGGSILRNVTVLNNGDASLIQAQSLRDAAGAAVGGAIGSGAAGNVAVTVAGHLDALLALGDAANRGGNILADVVVGRVDAIQSQYGDITGDVEVKNDNVPAADRGTGLALGRLQAAGGDITGKVEVKNGGNAGTIQATAAGGNGGQLASGVFHVAGDVQWVWSDILAAPVQVDGTGQVRTTDVVNNTGAGSHGLVWFGGGGYVWDPRNGWTQLNAGQRVYTHAPGP